jgi:hypothetical protein
LQDKPAGYLSAFEVHGFAAMGVVLFPGDKIMPAAAAIYAVIGRHASYCFIAVHGCNYH